MPGIKALVSALSADVVTQLAALPVPIVLTDGAILIGRKHVLEESSPPRIVFVPIGSGWGPARDVSSSAGAATLGQGNTTAEQKAQYNARSIVTDQVRFEVHCWGQASPPDDETGGDIDATQVIYQQVIQTAQRLAPGRWYLEGALRWASQAKNDPQHARNGQEVVFFLAFDTPVLEQAITAAPPQPPLVTVPPTTVIKPTIQITPPDGSAPEQAYP